MRQGSADRLTQEDRRRFEEIFLPHLDAAYNLARWIIRHDQDAQDVVQDAYIRAFRGFHLFRWGNSRSWVLTIVRNTAYTFLNRRAAEKSLIPYEEEKHANIISIDDPDHELPTEAQRKNLQRAREALEQLPLQFREAIILYELEGSSYKELASTLGVPVGTVMSRLSRARRRLRQEFAGVRHTESQDGL